MFTTVVQQYRKSKGWSQQHLADLCSVNLRIIQRVENSHTCSLETLNAMLAVFEIERDELVIQQAQAFNASDYLYGIDYRLCDVVDAPAHKNSG